MKNVYDKSSFFVKNLVIITSFKMNHGLLQ